MLRQSAKSKLQKISPQPLLELAYDLRYFGLPEPFRTVRPHSLLSYINLFFLQELAQRLEREEIPGDFVECGVYRGGSAGVLGYEAKRSKFSRRLWLYDSFAGMPETVEKDDDSSRSLTGSYVGSEQQTRRIMHRLKVPEEQYTIVVGLFEDTFPAAERVEIALLHIDCDFYNPVKLSLEKFYEFVQPGGYVLLNDYGYFQGSRLATDEFISQLNHPVHLVQIDKEAYYFQKPKLNSENITP
ncbi:TylF/MycF/NovP-related O-methyltransferase [Allocoleopsis franciscana]|uniref:Macrocin-O-methyltransferase (TylF) n=1 Tax=Allocoleopsis franciscana PCC 7113 TaxID=1173027 RepID=K9WNK1_9CYAN|nr:TylF/MycF/NovP-related O-methyltransferase [Allocoleopsis franciscana]AFZ21391.1 Macrocin-O-methyltransferase (TylF) [Allocoleopsis franciscana PCC 7113]